MDETSAEDDALMDALEAFGREAKRPSHPGITNKDQALLDYALALTQHPASITRSHIDAMRAAGCDDGEILDANQVTAYFAYANRVVDGLGVELETHHRSTAPG